MAFELSFLRLCLFISNGTLDYSIDDLVAKLHNLENKIETMSDTVAELTSEIENLRTRVEDLEKLISKRETTLSLPREKAEMDKTVHTKATGFKKGDKDKNLF